MTQSQSKIPFHNLTFYDDLPKMRDVEARLKTFLETTRKRAQRIEIEAGRLAEEDRVYPYDLVDDADILGDVAVRPAPRTFATIAKS